MNIVDLPTDIMLPVLLYLSQEDIIRNVRLVCTHWYKLCEEACFWKHLRIRTADRGTIHTSPTFREFVERVSDRVEKLDIIAKTDDKGQPVEEKHLDIADINFPKLKSIVCATSLSSTFFNKFIEHNSHVQYLDFQLAGEYDYINSLQKIASLEEKDFKGLFIFYINMDHRYPLADTVINRGHSLEKIIFFECKVSLDKLFISLSRHPSFQHLDIRYSRIFTSCPPCKPNTPLNSLIKVRIWHGEAGDSVLEYISTWAPSLKELYINESQFGDITDMGISRLVSNCPDLAIIQITDNEYSKHCITDVGLESIARCCRQLQVLNISLPSKCTLFTDAGITAVGHSCPLLRELHVANCLSLTDDAVRSLAKSCYQLEVLNFTGCRYLTSHSVTDAVTRSCRLVRLQLNKCVRIENIILDGDEYRGKHSRGEDDRPNVSGVDIETVETEMAALHADSEVSTGTDHCNEKQRAVNISVLSEEETSASNEGSTDTVIKTYSSRLSLLENHYHLKALHLNGCYRLSDESIIQISSHCPDLNELRIDGCSLVTDSGVSELVTKCELLTILSFNNDSRSAMFDDAVPNESMITDVAMFNIARHCKYLQYLGVRKHHNITTDGIAAVADGCPNIERIAISTNKRSNVSIQQLKEALSKVTTRSKCIRIQCFVKYGTTHDIIYKLGVGEMTVLPLCIRAWHEVKW